MTDEEIIKTFGAVGLIPRKIENVRHYLVTYSHPAYPDKIFISETYQSDDGAEKESENDNPKR